MIFVSILYIAFELVALGIDSHSDDNNLKFTGIISEKK
jgi:hypothetical protein